MGMGNVQEGGRRLTVDVIKTKAKGGAELRRFQDARALLGRLYDTLPPGEALGPSAAGVKPGYIDKIEDGLRAEAAMWQSFVQPAENTRDALQTEVTFSELPGQLSVPVWSSLRRAGMSTRPIPAFPIENRRNLQKIVEGNGASAEVDVFTREYLERVFAGDYPIPDLEGYFMAVDGPDKVTELSDALEIGNVYTATPQGVQRAFERNGDAALRSLGIDPASEVQLVGVSAKEGRLLVVQGIDEKRNTRATRTRRNGSGTRVVLTSRGITEESERSETPTRLGIVFQAPKPEQYLPKKR